MKIQESLTVLGVAAVTLALIVALAGPARVEAVDGDGGEGTEVQPVIERPTWEWEGLRITVTTQKQRYAPAEKPVILLHVTNPTQQFVATDVWLGLNASAVTNPMSRVISLPQSVWTQQTSLAVKPGETREYEIPTAYSVAEQTSVTVTIGDTDRQASMALMLNSQQ